MLIRTLGLGAAFALLMCATAVAAPVTVNLRVEGSTQTLFEGPVTTDGHYVKTDSGGDDPGHVGRHCDGTNGGANTSPGPTMTSALDDGAKAAGFTFDGTYDTGYDDFFITRIGSDTNTGAPAYQPYWYSFRNWVDPGRGGCQQQVQSNDEALWVYTSFAQPLLDLSGAPTVAQTGQAFNVQVLQHDGNGSTAPAAAASVGGQSTGPDGRVTISFTQPGVQRLKATRSDAIRSNAQEVCVENAGSGTCSGFKPTVGGAAPESDKTRPVARVTGLRSGKHYRRGPRTLKGKASDRGMGLRDVRLRLNWVARKGCRFFDGKLERFTKPGTCDDDRFFSIGDSGEWSYVLPDRLAPGRYTLTVKVVDKAGNFDVERVRFVVTA